VFLEWKLKGIRFKQQKKLNKTNLHLYKSITTYIQNSELKGIEKEEILQQIMDMMLQAEVEDKSMNLIIGHDYEAFCKSIVKEYSRDKITAYRVLLYIQKSLLWMIIISVLLMVSRSLLNTSFNIDITVDYLIIASIFSFILVPATRKRAQETSSQTLWYQRLYTINTGLGKSGSSAFILMIFTLALIRLVLGKVLGTKVFSYTINLYENIFYVGLILLIIIAIEGYKIMYNKKEDIIEKLN